MTFIKQIKENKNSNFYLEIKNIRFYSESNKEKILRYILHFTGKTLHFN